MSTRPIHRIRLVIVASLVATSVVGLASRPTIALADDCRDSELVALYPGYPDFRGYLPDTVGGQEWVCPDEFPRSFDPSDEDRENERAADRLDISGSIEDWTWENWMAIEAERGLRPTCFSCVILDPPAIGTLDEPERRVDREDDARYVLGTFESTNIAYRVFVANDLPVGRLGEAPTDYELRAIMMMASADGYLNAEQVVGLGEEFLRCMYAPIGTDGCPGGYVDTSALCRNIIKQHGYSPTPSEATYEDQGFTVFVGFWALQRFMTNQQVTFIDVSLKQAVVEWKADLAKDASTAGFGEWLEDNGGLGWC